MEKVFKRVFHLKIMSTKTSREIALDRRKAMSDGGKKAALNSSSTQDRVRSSQDIKTLGTKSSSAGNITKSSNKQIPVISTSSKLSSKELVIERRKAMSTHGKSASKQNNSAASLARRGDPDLSSREISQRVRELRSKTGDKSKMRNGKCRQSVSYTHLTLPTKRIV